jgi:uncharacterized protein YjiS (DUF1127 family)
VVHKGIQIRPGRQKHSKNDTEMSVLCAAAQLQKMHDCHALIAIVCEPVAPYLLFIDRQHRPYATISSGDVEMATTFTRAAIAPFGAITVHRIITAVSNMATTLRIWNETRRTVNVLRSLSPAQLDDIGLTRGDVEDFGRKRF